MPRPEQRRMDAVPAPWMQNRIAAGSAVGYSRCTWSSKVELPAFKPMAGGLFVPDRPPNGERLPCGNHAKMMKLR